MHFIAIKDREGPRLFLVEISCGSGREHVSPETFFGFGRTQLGVATGNPDCISDSRIPAGAMSGDPSGLHKEVSNTEAAALCPGDLEGGVRERDKRVGEKRGGFHSEIRPLGGLLR